MDVLRALSPNAEFQQDTELWINPSELAAADQMLAEAFGAEGDHSVFLAIQPGGTIPAKRQDKRWDPARYALVADNCLSHNPAIRIVLLGGPEEAETAAAMRSSMSDPEDPRVANFVGKLDLRGSLSVLSRMRLFLGNDTAIMHAAIALSVPTVALFGPTNCRKWGTWRDDVAIIESQDGCMDSIPVERVIDALTPMLDSLRPCRTGAQV